MLAGGRSFGCPENFGGAGTLFESVLRSLIVSNHNLTTQTDTVFLEFPNPPLWTNIFVINHAKVSLLLLWSRVQVSGASFYMESYPKYVPFFTLQLFKQLSFILRIDKINMTRFYLPY